MRVEEGGTLGKKWWNGGSMEVSVRLMHWLATSACFTEISM